MSGGSYDYAYSRIDDLAEAIRAHGSCSCGTPSQRKAFAEHLRLVARVCRAIEWNDSGDGDDSERDLLAQILTPRALLEVALDDARAAPAELKDAVAAAEAMENTTAQPGKET